MFTNNINLSILVFLTIFIIFVYIKPNFMYNKNGLLRNFGIGKRNSTVLPIWLIVILLAIISYVLVLNYSNLE
jgi:hypothetical protein